jgi:hypothetical protein
MWSKLERGFAAAALACCVLLVAGVPAAYGQEVKRIDNTYSSAVVTIGGKHSAYRLLFSPSSRFADSKVYGILLLQVPGYKWQAFVAQRGGECHQLGKATGAPAEEIKGALKELQPLEEGWPLPSALPGFSTIVDAIGTEFGRLDEATGKAGEGGLPTNGENTKIYAKVVLGCKEDPVFLTPVTDIGKVVRGELSEGEVTSTEAKTQGRQESPQGSNDGGDGGKADEDTRQDAIIAANTAKDEAATAAEGAGATLEQIRTAAADRSAETMSLEKSAEDAVTEAGIAKRDAEAAATNAADAENATAANEASDKAKEAAERAKAESEKVQDVLKMLSGKPEAVNGGPADAEARLREHDRALADKEAKIRELEGKFETSQARIRELEEELKRLHASSGAGSQVQAKVLELEEQLRDAAGRVERAEKAAENLQLASTRNWEDLVTFAETPLSNEIDRIYTLKQWIRERKVQPIALGPVERVAPTEKPTLFDTDWLINLVVGTILLLLLILVSLLVYLILRQGRIANSVAERVMVVLRTAQLFGEDSNRAPRWKPELLLESIQSLYQSIASWATVLDKRGQELIDDPLQRALERLRTFKSYRPRPIAEEGNTVDTSDGLPAGQGAAGPARGLAAQPAPEQPQRQPIYESAARRLGEVEKQQSAFGKALIAFAQAGNSETGQPVPLSPETLPQARAWMLTNQQMALPLAELFRVVTNGLSSVLRRSHEELSRRDTAIDGLMARNAETRNELAATRTRAEQFQRFTTLRLQETGFIASADSVAPDALTEAMERFDGVRHFPERLDYARRLISLRDYLDNLRVQDLPYFRAAGLNDLHENLGKRRGDWQSIFHGDDAQQTTKALIGQWGFILQYLYRSRRLLQTYWPKEVDPDLWLRLDRAHAAVRTVLERYDICPHRVELLKPLNEVQQPGKIIADDTKDLPPELLNSQELKGMFEQLPYPDNEKVIVDIASWGIDCKAVDAGQMGKTLLISRSKRGGLKSVATT